MSDRTELPLPGGVRPEELRPDRPADTMLPRLLRAAREHLNMDVSFISEFTGGQRVFRYVDADDPGPVRIGDGGPLEGSFCQRVVDGRLPQLITDARQVPAACELPVTTELPVGAHMSVPLVLADGTVFGTFCCFSHEADASLNERDLAVVRLFADVAGEYLEADRAAAEQKRSALERVGAALASDGHLETAFQPVVALGSGRVIGVEALSRFAGVPRRPPNEWFDEAESLGLGEDLELRAVEVALQALAEIPEPLFLGLNVSPAVAQSDGLFALLRGVELERVVLEMTEHAPVADYHELGAALQPLRQRGLRIAVDDAGAGYASLRHILWLTPDWIKLDLSITRGIDADPARAALATALIHFAHTVGSDIIAEGIETSAEERTLRAIGARAGQGYHLGRPTTLSQALGRSVLLTR